MALYKLPSGKISHSRKEDLTASFPDNAMLIIENSESQTIRFFHPRFDAGIVLVISRDEELSVRTTEELSQKAQKEVPEEPVRKTVADDYAKNYETLKNHLAGFFQTGVDLKRNAKGSGKIIISFGSDDELERIIGIFDRLKQ